MEEPRFIRKNIIAPNRATLEQLGSLCEKRTNPGPRGGRPGVAFYLNEQQAILACMYSRTEKAREVHVQVVKVFAAWRSVHPSSWATIWLKPFALRW